MLLPNLKKTARLILGGILPKPSRFLIVSRGRTGSNLLLSLLHSHRSIYMVSEAVGEWQLNDPEQRAEILRLGVVPYIEQCFGRTLFEAAVGIKTLYYQIEKEHGLQYGIPEMQEILAFLQSQQDIKIIHLKRRNRLQTLASNRVAKLTRKYRAEDQGSLSDDKAKITLDTAECEQEFELIGEKEAFYDEAFKNHPKLEVYYENLVAGQVQECGRILDFLGVRRQPLKTTMKKQRTRPLSEVIENYEELKKYFSATEWARFFDVA